MIKIVKAVISLLVPLVFSICYACAHTPSLPAIHTVQENNLEMCSECHSDWRSALTHRPDYSTRHRFYAYQQPRTCTLCHREAFCSDCHAHKEEIKPSDKYKEFVTRDMPHRGDYLSQHQIDGRIYPALCVKCHGRQNNERCRVCHR